MRTRKPGVFLFFFGLFFVLLSLPFHFWLGESKSYKGETEGVIFDLGSHVSDSGTVLYTPHVEFFVDGESYRFRSDTSSNTYANSIGKIVVVIYDEDNPENATLKSTAVVWWIFPWVFTIVGGAVMLTGVKIIIFGVKRTMTIDERYGYR